MTDDSSSSLGRSPGSSPGGALGRPRHLLEVTDLSSTELLSVLDLAERPLDLVPRVLDGKGVALLFEKPSARTRHSTEVAVIQLGGHPVTARGDEVGLDERESTEDVTRTLQSYHAAICARVFDHRKLERMTTVARVPIVNLLSDVGHPLQAIADLLTVRQSFGRLRGLRVAWIGDFSNVARSLSLAATMVGATVAVSTPPGYGPTMADHDLLALHGGRVEVHRRPADAVEEADCVVTDAWYSMGQEVEKAARVKAFEGYTVTPSLLGFAKPEAVFLHCLPAHRGQEVTDDVLDGPQSRIWPEAENRLHAARAVLAFLLTKSSSAFASGQGTR
jgi:ornithine carbamoyltransferase